MILVKINQKLPIWNPEYILTLYCNNAAEEKSFLVGLVKLELNYNNKTWERVNIFISAQLSNLFLNFDLRLSMRDEEKWIERHSKNHLESITFEVHSKRKFLPRLESAKNVAGSKVESVDGRKIFGKLQTPSFRSPHKRRRCNFSFEKFLSKGLVKRSVLHFHTFDADLI